MTTAKAGRRERMKQKEEMECVQKQKKEAHVPEEDPTGAREVFLERRARDMETKC